MQRAALTEMSPRNTELTRDYLFDPIVWAEAFRAASSKAERMRLRTFILEGTRRAAVEESYWVIPGGKMSWENAKKVPLITHAHTLEYAAMFDYANEREPALALRESRYTSTAHFIYGTCVFFVATDP